MFDAHLAFIARTHPRALAVLTSELEGSMVHVRLRGDGAKAITISLTNDGRPISAEPGARLTASFDPDRAVVLPQGPLADE